MSHNLTIGDVLPSGMKSSFSAAVLGTSIDEATKIAKFMEPPTSPLSEGDVNEIKQIYSDYIDNNNQKSDSAYWNKSEADNEAYWNKG